MTQKSRLCALFLATLILTACSGGSQPTYSLDPGPDATKKPLPNPGLDDTQPGNPEVWPADLKNILMVCEIPQSEERRSAAIAWTTTAATDRAGYRLARFPINGTKTVPENLKRPEITSETRNNAFDVVFEGSLNVGPKGGLMDMREHLFTGNVTLTNSTAKLWTRLSDSRLANDEDKMAKLPSFVRLAHTFRVTPTDWVLPSQKDSNFELFEKSPDTSEFKRIKSLDLGLKDSFPLAAFADAVVFQRYASGSWSLSVVENLRGKIVRRSVSGARYLADVQDDTLWGWSSKSSKEWNLSRYTLRSGTYVIDTSGPALQLAQPTLARRFDVELKNAQGRESGWIVARDDLAMIQIYSDDFKLKSELAYPLGAKTALNAQSVSENSAIFAMEFKYAPGEYRATLIHALRTELRGPIGQSICARPSL